jgi:hypothetical protein
LFYCAVRLLLLLLLHHFQFLSCGHSLLTFSPLGRVCCRLLCPVNFRLFDLLFYSVCLIRIMLCSSLAMSGVTHPHFSSRDIFNFDVQFLYFGHFHKVLNIIIACYWVKNLLIFVVDASGSSTVLLISFVNGLF